jgi:hypothetical protein
MPQFGTQTEANFFRVFARGINDVIADAERMIQQYVSEQTALGRDPRDVYAELEASQKGDLGLMKKIVGRFEAKIQEGGNIVFQIASNEPLKDMAEKFVWTLDPAAEHCDSCLAQAGMGPRAWEDIPYPTTQPKIGETNCETFCKCTLSPEVAIVA